MPNKAQSTFRSIAYCLVSISILSFISCGGSADAPKTEQLVMPETTQAPQAEEPSTTESTPTGALVITDIRKDGAHYSATLNNAIVFKGLEINDDKLFFPETSKQGDRSFRCVYLDDKSIAVQIKAAIKAGKGAGKGEPGAIKVTGVRWNEYSGGGKLHGFADVTFNSAITVKGYKLLDGKNGLWLAWPSVKKGDEFDDLVFSIDKGVRDMVEAAVRKEAGK